MEGSVFGSFHILKLFSVLLEITFCSLLLLVFQRVFKNQSLSEMYRPKFFGTLGTLFSYKKRGWIWEQVHSDYLQIVNGFSALYPKKDLIDIYIGFTHFVLLNKAELIQEFLMSKVSTCRPRCHVFVPWFGNSFAVSIAPGWKSRKNLVMPMFHNRTLEMQVPTFDENAKILIDILKRREKEDWIDVRNVMELYSMDCSCEMAVGTNASAQLLNDSEYVMAMRRASRAAMKRMLNPFLFSDFVFWRTASGRQFRKDINYLRGFIKKVIHQRKTAQRTQSKYKDLLSFLLDVHMQNKDIIEDDVIDEIASFIFGGQDTTAAGMTWTLYLIGLYPDVQRKVHEELDSIFGDDNDRPFSTDDLSKLRYLECVLKECHRIYPPIPTNARQLCEDFHIGGRNIKKGSYIMISHYDLHRKSDVFSNPEKFDPDRFLPENSLRRNPFAYLPFSAGNRSCAGRRLAIIEEKVVIANVLRNFSVKSLDQRDKLHVSVDFVLHSKDPLRLKFTRRIPNVNDAEI